MVSRPRRSARSPDPTRRHSLERSRPLLAAPGRQARNPGGRPLVGAIPTLVVLLVAGGCARTVPTVPQTGDWYVLRDGGLVRGRPAADSATHPTGLPWTVQSRIADLILRDGVLHLAINGIGLSASTFPPNGAFTDPHEPLLYRGRTIAEIYPEPDGMLVHLYLNRTLAAPQGPSDVDGGPVLLHVPWTTSGEVAVREVTPPYRAKNPGWEPVAVVRTSGTTYAMEWKWTDDTRTEFFYTSYAADTGRETPMDRTAFRAAYGFASRSTDGSVQALFQAVIRATGQPARPPTAVHLVLRDGETTLRLRYQPPGYTEARDVDLVVVPGRRAGQTVWALTASGELFGVAQGSQRALTQRLTTLPDGYRYVLFDVSPDPQDPRVAAAWEETRFTTVGEAGLYVGSIQVP